MSDLQNMLNKKSFREMQKSKTGEELLDLIYRPTAKESAVPARVLDNPTFLNSSIAAFCYPFQKLSV